MVLEWKSILLDIITLGNRIYRHRDRSDFNLQRLLVFWLRGLKHGRLVRGFARFFAGEVELSKLERNNAIFYEQLSRHVFYHNSTMAERCRLIEQHFLFCQQMFSAAALEQIYYDQRLLLWQQEELSLGLDFFYVDRKEGLMTLDLMREGKRVYHITFWLGQDDAGENALFIGALQGSLGGRELIHALTKRFFGCRPKNFMLYVIQQMAGIWGLQHIYAISNRGFYTNNHVRLDRKLKTSLDAFWQEVGGWPLEDPRFYELPLQSVRKPLETVKTHKRSQYRKRYVWLDEIAAAMKENWVAFRR